MVRVGENVPAPFAQPLYPHVLKNVTRMAPTPTHKAATVASLLSGLVRVTRASENKGNETINNIEISAAVATWM
jgi:hypothetical protein